MRRTFSARTHLAVLALIWLIGAGLWFAPTGATERVRGTLRDVLAPGQRGVQAFSDQTASLWREWRGALVRSDRVRLEELECEADRWRRRALGLEVRSAELTRRLEGAGSVDGPFAAAASEPLLVNNLIDARILGRTRADLERRLRPIIDRGARHDVDVDDIVLADDRLHLDLGADAGLDRDHLVIDGARIIGRIESVGRWTSTIQPVTDPDFRGAAQLVREGADGPIFGAEGILAGDGAGGCRLQLIGAADPVSIGDSVFLPAQRSGLPGSVYYGRVVDAQIEAGAPYWSIQVEPATGAHTDRHLQVLVETPNPRRLTDLRADARRREEALR